MPTYIDIPLSAHPVLRVKEDFAKIASKIKKSGSVGKRYLHTCIVAINEY